MTKPLRPPFSFPPASHCPGGLIRLEILIPLKLGITEAAALLRTDRARFGCLLRGTLPLNPATAARIEAVFGLPMEHLMPNESPEVLATWRSRIAAKQLARYRPTPARRTRHPRRFEIAGAEADAFGLLLWKAIGVGRGRFREAAQKLGLDPSELSGIIHGRRRPTQDMLRRRALFARLQAAFPAGWREHGAALVDAATRLPAHRHRARRLR